MGFVCIFDYINLKEGPTRLKYFFYYTVLTMEAGILMTVWYIKILDKVSVHTVHVTSVFFNTLFMKHNALREHIIP